MPTLKIEVVCDDVSDAEWLRNKCVPAVEETVEESREEGRLDGSVDVGWSIDDDE